MENWIPKEASNPPTSSDQSQLREAEPQELWSVSFQRNMIASCWGIDPSEESSISVGLMAGVEKSTSAYPSIEK